MTFKIKKIDFLFWLICGSLIYLSCDQTNMSETTTTAGVSIDQPIDIKDYKHHLPETAGYDVFEANCITCHSLRYIEMQPDFPKKTWENIVHKMVKSFGAPIPDSSVQTIVNYLAEVKGIKEK